MHHSDVDSVTQFLNAICILGVCYIRKDSYPCSSSPCHHNSLYSLLNKYVINRIEVVHCTDDVSWFEVLNQNNSMLVREHVGI